MNETESANSKSNFWVAVVSGVLLWLAFPPVGWFALGWVAPAGWCYLVRREAIAADYRWLYLAGLLHWLLLIQWIRLPHWSAYFGWIALSLYLAVYLPAFVGLSRILVHRWRAPLVLACPIVWVGLEYARGYLLTGFSMSLLGHSQVAWLNLIQLAGVFGSYGVSFLMMTVAAAVSIWLPFRSSTATALDSDTDRRQRWGRWAGAALAIGLLIAALVYGQHVRHEISGGAVAGKTNESKDNDAALTVALIQGSKDTTFDDTEDPAKNLKTYRQLTHQAIADHPQTDLIVWPESMHPPWYAVTWPATKPPDFQMTDENFQRHLRLTEQYLIEQAGWFGRQFGKPALVGCPTAELGPHPERRRNSALAIDATGQVVQRYDKMHPVMFGEYVPLGNLLPWLYALTPMPNGLTPGESPIAMTVGEYRFAPCICFENTVPHLIRRQVHELTAAGEPPHVLVTVTNDGWFWGSSLLDVHLACGVFRAVELRRPMLIAANTGFSAVIDRSGAVLRQGPRRATGVVMAELAADQVAPIVESAYFRGGDWFAGGCFAFSLLAAITRVVPSAPLLARRKPTGNTEQSG